MAAHKHYKTNKKELEEMKKSRQLLAIVLCMIAGLSISSCLSSSDDNQNTLQPLTQAQKEAQLREMAGIYNGFLYFTNDTTSHTDSIAVNWTITAPDSAIIIENFPTAVLANGISDQNLRKMLYEGGTRQLYGHIRPYVNEHNEDKYYTFLMTPNDYTMSFTTQQEGTDHQVKVEFAYQMTAYSPNSYYPINYYSNGEYNTGRFIGFLLVKDVKIDNSTFTTGRACYIYGRK